MLYNKYRPKKIEEIAGQDNVKNFLFKLTKGNAPHAVIFYGPPGTGKTTSARLLAKKLYCENPTPDGDVCGECASCKAAEEDSLVDFVEIDATSAGNVGYIRELKNRLELSTFSGNKRVVYLDEAHRLTKQAFDALLKIIEESKNNVFVFATTEFDKVPSTVKSRSISFELKPLTVEELSGLLKRVAKSEGYELGDRVANAIAFMADGSPRNALVLLEQVLAHTDSRVISKPEDFPFLFTTEVTDAFEFFKQALKSNNPKDWVTAARKLPQNDEKIKPLAWSMFRYASKVAENNPKYHLIVFLSELSDALRWPTVTYGGVAKAFFEAAKYVRR